MKDIRGMLLFLKAGFCNWILSPGIFSDWYKLIAYRIAFILRKDPSVTFTLHTRNGVEFTTTAEGFGSIYECWLSKEYFPQMPYALPEKARIVDIGASIGLFTLYVAAQYPRSRVFSYEPVPDSFELLIDNVRRNHFENRVKASNAAVSSTGGESTFHVGNHNVLASLFAKGGQSLTVKTLTLDDIVSEVGKIDFLKLDAEGAEYEILLKAKLTTLKKISAISLEYHDHITPHNHSEILKTLENNGFKTKISAQHPGQVTGIIFASRMGVD